MAIELQTHSKSVETDKIKVIIDWLDDNYEIRINSFDTSQTRIVSKNKKYNYPISLNDISIHLISDGLKCSDTLLRKIVTSRNYMRIYNPVLEYFNKVRGTYKGFSHIDYLAAHLKAIEFPDRTNGYYNIRAIKLLKKWIVAAAACALGKAPNDVMLVFVQEQEGAGKTWLSKFICPQELKEMLTVSSSDQKVFSIEREFTSNFMVLFDEFLGLSGNNASETFKATMSAPEIKIKTKNDPFPVSKPRIASAIATTNNKTGKYSGFLTKGLGTRRFAIIHLESINFEYVTKIDVDQIWAEALMLCESDNSFNYKWDQADFEEFRDYNVRYMIETPATVLISQNYRQPSEGEDGVWLQPQDIISDLKERRLLKSEFVKDITPERIGEALRSLGFVSKPKRFQGEKNPRYRYYLYRI